MFSLSMSRFPLKHLSSTIKSASNHGHVSKTIINLSILETPCRDFKKFKQILSQMILTGFIKDTFFAKRLLQFSTWDLNFIHLDYSYQIFNVIENPDASIYNMMMMAYVRGNYPHRAIHFYKLMLYRNVGPNVNTYPFLVEACAMRKCNFEGKQMHNHVLKLGFDSDVHVRSTFVDMYADYHMLIDARQVFDEGPMMGSFEWGSLWKGYEDRKGAEYIYSLMPEKNAETLTRMIVQFTRMGELEKAQQLINEIPKNDTVFWSELIYSFEEGDYEMYEEALGVFIWIHSNGICRIDEHVVKAALLVCKNFATVEEDVVLMGKLIHSLVVKIGIECDLELQSDMIYVYSTCGDLESAQNLFDVAGWMNDITWDQMLCGYFDRGLDEHFKALFESMPKKYENSYRLMMLYYSERDCFSESLALLLEMVRSGKRLSVDIWECIISYFNRFAAVDLGKCIHAYLIKKGYGLKPKDSLTNPLSRMYAITCGYKYDDERGFQ